LDGALHGGFTGGAVTGHGLFYALGGEGFDGSAGASGAEEDDASGVGHEDGGARVGVVGVEHLDGDDLGADFGEDFGEFAFEFDEAGGDWELGVEADDACVEEVGGAGDAAILDGTVTGDAETGIDAEDAHGGSVTCHWSFVIGGCRSEARFCNCR
jgi:hypothetical protein